MKAKRSQPQITASPESREPDPPWKNVVQRLIECRAAIPPVKAKRFDMKKNGHVIASFDSLSHFDVIEHCRPFMAQHGLLLLPTVKAWAKSGNSTVIELAVDVINADDPQDTLSFVAIGEANDNGDKGVGKATSYAKKFAYVLALELALGEADTEEEHIDTQSGPQASSETATQTQQAQQPASAPPAAQHGGQSAPAARPPFPYGQQAQTYQLNLVGAVQTVSHLDVVNFVAQAINACPTADDVDDLIERNKSELQRVWQNNKHDGFAISELASIRKSKLANAAQAA